MKYHRRGHGVNLEVGGSLKKLGVLVAMYLSVCLKSTCKTFRKERSTSLSQKSELKKPVSTMERRASRQVERSRRIY